MRESTGIPVMSDQSMQSVCADQEVAVIPEDAVEASAGNKERLTDSGTVKSRNRHAESIADHIVIPLPGLGTLELPSEVFDKHLLRTQNSSVKGEQPSPELLDANQLEKRTGIPASWWAAQARERRVPFHKFGRYVRFDITEIFACDVYRRPVVDDSGHSRRRGLR